MSQLIGKIQYPAKDASLSAAWCTLTAEAGATTLRFALINRSEKTVNAYRVAVSYTAAGEEHRETVAEKSLSLVAGATSAEHEIALPVGVEEGVLTVEAAIYDDLSHNDVPLAFPFARRDPHPWRHQKRRGVHRLQAPRARPRRQSFSRTRQKRRCCRKPGG